MNTGMHTGGGTARASGTGFLCGLLALLVVLTGPSVRADELRFNRVFVLGDSLSDGGTYSQAVVARSGGRLPDMTYRFTTNAPDGSSRTYAGYLAGALGVDLKPHIINGLPVAQPPYNEDIRAGGTSFAQGGARIETPAGINHDPATGVTTLPLRGQVDRLLAGGPGFNTNDLVVVWGGANDVLAQAAAIGGGHLAPDSGVANMVRAADMLSADINRLKAAGARTIIVLTIPDIGTTPFGLAAEAGAPGTGALLNGLGDAFNARLLAAAPQQDLIVIDSGKLLGVIQANPGRYGFTAPGAATRVACPDSSLSCIQGVNAADDSEALIFADPVHPTAAAHALLGQAALATLTAVSQAGAIPVATLTAIRQHALSLEPLLTPFALFTTDRAGDRVRREVGDVDVFVNLDTGYHSVDDQQIFPGMDGHSSGIRIGLDVPLGANSSVGVLLSADRDRVDFDGDRGGFRNRRLGGTVFGQMALTGEFYVNAAAGGGHIDVYNINRRFKLGPSLESYKAESNGYFFSGRVGGGAVVPVTDGLWFNPFGHYTYETVAIDGFTEQQGPVSLAFGKMTYDAHRLTGGLSLQATPAALPGVTLGLRGSLEYDLGKEYLSVPVGQTKAALGGISIPRPDRFRGYFSASAATGFENGMQLNVGASGSLGLNGMTGYAGSASLKLPF